MKIGDLCRLVGFLMNANKGDLVLIVGAAISLSRSQRSTRYFCYSQQTGERVWYYGWHLEKVNESR